jgi:hypothetical protein
MQAPPRSSLSGLAGVGALLIAAAALSRVPGRGPRRLRLPPAHPRVGTRVAWNLV